MRLLLLMMMMVMMMRLLLHKWRREVWLLRLVLLVHLLVLLVDGEVWSKLPDVRIIVIIVGVNPSLPSLARDSTSPASAASSSALAPPTHTPTSASAASLAVAAAGRRDAGRDGSAGARGLGLLPRQRLGLVVAVLHLVRAGLLEAVECELRSENKIEER